MIPDTAIWVIINAIRSGCQCKACASTALEKALSYIPMPYAPDKLPPKESYTSGAVWTNPTTSTNGGSNGLGEI